MDVILYDWELPVLLLVNKVKFTPLARIAPAGVVAKVTHISRVPSLSDTTSTLGRENDAAVKITKNMNNSYKTPISSNFRDLANNYS